MISKSLVATLLVWIAQHTGYAIPGDMPEIDQVPYADLESRYCHGPCAILGLTTPQGIVLLDSNLQIDADPAATSILVHELTHFLQRANAPAGMTVDCKTWMAREEEAYDMQYTWLHETAPSIRVLSAAMAELGTQPIILNCTGDHAASGQP